MLTAIMVNMLVVMIVVGFHYEALHQLSRLMPLIPLKARPKIVLGVCWGLVAHAVEIWVFAAAYYIAITYLNYGQLGGGSVKTLMDCAYYSFTVFTTLGFGDITPDGHLRFLTGLESLTGLVLITWSASYFYLEMQKNWDQEPPVRKVEDLRD